MPDDHNARRARQLGIAEAAVWIARLDARSAAQSEYLDATELRAELEAIADRLTAALNRISELEDTCPENLATEIASALAKKVAP